jgi:hypothetical protein
MYLSKLGEAGQRKRMSESLVEHNNKKLQITNKRLRAANKKLRDALADMEEQLEFRKGELEHVMLTLDEERAAKEKAQAEVARVEAKAQEEVNRIRVKAREEVNRIHDKALEEIARKKGEYEARTEKNKAEAQKVVDLAKGQVKTERARALAATFTLKEAQRDSRNHLRLKAAFKVVSGMANSRTAP